jgi:hypothetical protein
MLLLTSLPCARLDAPVRALQLLYLTLVPGVSGGAAGLVM